MSAGAELELAHKAVNAAMGKLVVMLVKKSVSRTELLEVRRLLRAGLARLDVVLGE